MLDELDKSRANSEKDLKRMRSFRISPQEFDSGDPDAVEQGQIGTFIREIIRDVLLSRANIHSKIEGDNSSKPKP